MMESSNGVPPPADSLYSGIETTEEPLSSPETPFVDTTPTDTPTDLGSPSGVPPNALSDEEREELQKELNELNDDIEALRLTLQSKETKLKEIKRKLGITPMGEFTNKARQSWGNVQQSQAYQSTSGKLKEWNEAIVSSETYNKTKTGLQTAGQKTGAAFTSFGSAVSRKLGEVRGSNAFKSFEEKVSTAATSVKSRVSRSSQNGDTFQDTLNESPGEGDSMPTSLSADNIPLNTGS